MHVNIEYNIGIRESEYLFVMKKKFMDGWMWCGRKTFLSLGVDCTENRTSNGHRNR